MNTVKAEVDVYAVETFMFRHPVHPAVRIVAVPSGERSQPFRFTSHGNDYVIRLNYENFGFAKDAYAAKLFSNQPMPVPDIMLQGNFDSRHHYAISEYVEGWGLYDFGKKVPQAIIEQITHCMDVIHSTPVMGSGFGQWRSHDFNAPYNSWYAALKGICEIYDWKRLFETGVAQRHSFEKLYDAMLELMPRCPQEQWLIHGDFKGANIRHNGQVITGVLDWSESMYGDYLYDVAWIDLWDERTDYRQEFYDHYAAQERVPLFYNERIRCYQYYSALLSLGFNASTNQPAKYRRVEELIKRAGLL